MCVKFSNSQKSAFTLIEVMATVAIIAILSSVVAISYSSWQNNTYTSAVKSDGLSVISAIENARNFSTSGYPTTASAIYKTTANVNIVGGSADSGKSFCVDITHNKNAAIKYYVDSIDKAVLPGTCATRTGILSAPTNVVATTVSNSSISVNFTTVSGATGYNIQSSTNSAFTDSKTIATLGASPTLPYTTSSLDENKTYYYRVQTLKSATASSWSTIASAKTSDSTISAPTAPTISRKSIVSSSTFSWSSTTCSSGYIAKYQYKYEVNSPTGYTSNWKNINSGNSLSFTTTTGPIYTVSIRSACANNEKSSDWSQVSQNNYNSTILASSSIGTGNDEHILDMIKTSDGGNIMVGYAIVSSVWRGLVIKTNSDGSISWSKIINQARFYGVIQTSDGGYALSGYGGTDGSWSSYVGNVVMKLSSSGDISWSSFLSGIGTGSTPLLKDLVQASDGSIYAVGNIGFWTDDSGVDGILIIKYPATGGAATWTRVWGGLHGDGANAVVATSDGGVLVVGSGQSYTTGWRAYALKVTSAGAFSWNKSYGVSGSAGLDVLQASDGNYVIAGYTTISTKDAMLVKTNTSGGIIWSRILDGTGDEIIESVAETADGGYIISGYTGSYGAGGADAYISKFDVNGNYLWTRVWGGAGDDNAKSVALHNDGSIAISGYTSSFGAGSYDAYLIKYNLGIVNSGCSPISCSSVSPTITTTAVTTSSITSPYVNSPVGVGTAKTATGANYTVNIIDQNQ